MKRRNKIYNSFRLFFLTGIVLLSVMVTDAFCEGAGVKTKKEFCDAVNLKFKEFQWDSIICNPDRWEIFDYSTSGNPLLYQEFGFTNPGNNGPVNLVLCGVHGDEPSAVFQCFNLVRDIVYDNPLAAKHLKIVVAPIVNPDGFFLNSRQNADGVDPNRNLPTRDWHMHAHKVWERHNRDPRKYPGDSPGTAAEARLQTYLIEKYHPDKVISFHAPLGFLDFDGPGDRKYYDLVRVEKRARHLGLSMESDTKKFLKFVDYRFYPGSLGNYAGNEREIPTYTLELPTAFASKAHDYWTIMRMALINALSYHIFEGEERHPLSGVQQKLDEAEDTDIEIFNII